MPDIILKNRNGKSINYPGVSELKAKTVDGGVQHFGAYDPEKLTPDKLAAGETVGNVTGALTVPKSEEKTITPDFSGGDMEVTPGEGAMFSKVTVQKPENLLPGNIAEGVDIAGIIGTLAAGGGGTAKVAYGTVKSAGTALTIEHNLGSVPDVIFVMELTNMTGSTATVRGLYALSESFATKAGSNLINSRIYKSGSYSFSYGKLHAYSDTATTDSGYLYGATDTTFNLPSALDTTNTFIWYAIGGLT